MNELAKTKYRKMAALCSNKEYTALDIKLKLTAENFPKADIESIIELLQENKFIDHQRYAKAYVADKIKLNHWGKNKVFEGLMHKQIDYNTIKEALAEFDEEEYRKIAYHELLKKWKVQKNTEANDATLKLKAYMFNKGFDSKLVTQLLEQIMKENTEEE